LGVIDERLPNNERVGTIMKQEIKLNRSDDRPIAFMGEEIISESTKQRDDTRWYTIRVFKTDDGYMVGLAHITCWKGERDKYWAHESKTIAGVVAFLVDNSPEGPTPSDPPDKATQKQEILEEYQELVDWVSRTLEEVNGTTKEQNGNPDSNPGGTEANMFSA
jgi:hypothetical protein